MRIIFFILLFNVALCGRVDNATCYNYLLTDSTFVVFADGFIGAIQMTFSHDDFFSFELTDDALVADYNTENNETTFIVVSPEKSEIFTYSGEIQIIELIVANSGDYVEYCPELELSNKGYILNDFNIKEVYPNPFNPSTSITYNLESNENIKIEIYDIKGNLISTLYDGFQFIGTHQITWHADNHPSGIYFISLNSPQSQSVQKVILQK